MLDIEYAPEFVRTWKKLPVAIQDVTVERIELFRDRTNHRKLKVHKLSGSMKGRWSFSVDFRYRIVFMYSLKDKNLAQMLDVGDHSVYE